jgi:hypothetical protein
MPRESNPSLDRAGQERLSICGLGVSLLARMAREEGVGVASFGGFKRGRGTAHFLKECSLKVLVLHLVAHEDDSTFVFTSRITGRELTVFLHADLEDSTNVNSSHCCSSFISNAFPRTDRGLIPSAHTSQLVPFFLECLLSSGRIFDFHFANGTSHCSK